MDEERKNLLKKLTAKEGLWISRVPYKVRSDFKKWAREEFEGDYGMGLKWLWDSYQGLILPPDSQVVAALQEMEDRLRVLEMKGEQSNEQEITLGNGKVIRRNRK